MTLSLEEVEHIADLAKLALSAEEKALYGRQLSAILDYAARLNAIDTEDISPTSVVLPFNTPLREDGTRPSLMREDLLANAPEAEDGMFQVDAVME
jgi:aspartyl-tRNA(Asn)/glutamyl-tRNA(Gln) amidotransferase subunit C